MAGIVAAGAYVPRYRLPRELIAKEWGGSAGPGEKAVANHDEDSLTLAVSAALGLVRDGGPIDGVFFATTTSPYTEKQGAATVAAVLDLPGGDADARLHRHAPRGDVGAARGPRCHRLGERAPRPRRGRRLPPRGARVGRRAELRRRRCRDPPRRATGSWPRSSPRTRSRTSSSAPGGRASRTSRGASPGAFETKFGYARVLGEVVKGVLAKAKVPPQELATVVLPTPNPRAPQGVAKALGLDAKKQLQESFWTTVGDTGTAQPLLMLAAALERAKPGDLHPGRRLRRRRRRAAAPRDGGAYGSGAERPSADRGEADPPVVRSLRALPAARAQGDGHRATRRRRSIVFRDRKELLPLYGGRCPKCGTVQFPKHRVCIECANPGGLEDVKLSRRGRLFTFTNDYLFDSPDPPVSHAVVDLDGGGRLYVQLTDCEPERVEIDMPLELTFRKVHEGGGFHNYFWKARPA